MLSSYKKQPKLNDYETNPKGVYLVQHGKNETKGDHNHNSNKTEGF